MPGDRVEIIKAELTVPFLRINDFKFFDSVRKKFILNNFGL